MTPKTKFRCPIVPLLRLFIALELYSLEDLQAAYGMLLHDFWACSSAGNVDWNVRSNLSGIGVAWVTKENEGDKPLLTYLPMHCISNA